MFNILAFFFFFLFCFVISPVPGESIGLFHFNCIHIVEDLTDLFELEL